ncbi:FAD-dependent monooxygenase [Actinomadura sp. 9N215]|uniref:FAD-dependent monooxygenase n=1 Tax=Actinomadura sp. 9N215 TaxID=3375150 RepID=UPI00379E6ABF
MIGSADGVIVVGAGPGGLLLAAELALAGVPCTVLERRSGRSAESRALGLQARTLELLQLRGIAGRFTSRGNPLDHFRVTVGPARIDLRRLDTMFQQLNICPQSLTEQLLEERATELGAKIERDARVVAVEQDADGVTLRVRGNDRTWEERASWVVGSDGSHSTVRESLGIGFPGKTYPYNIVVGDVRLARPPESGMLIEVGRSGLVVAIDFGNGWWRMGVVDWSTPGDPGEPATPEELSAALTTIFGYDLGVHDPLWMTRFRFQKRQATRYRSGRVFLLGDAAHVHAPLGAQGLNLSMQDAMNLGWKLGAVIRGKGPESLLDSYEAERRPVADRVLFATDKAIRVMMSQRLPVRMARRAIVPTVLRVPRGHQTLAGYVSGLAWAYPLGGGRRRGSSLTGRRVPDALLRVAGGDNQRLSDLFHGGRFVLVDQAGGRLAKVAEPWGAEVVTVLAQPRSRSPLAAWSAVLCRPDGYAAWSGGPEDEASLRTALTAWCGEPGVTRTETTAEPATGRETPRTGPAG